jgi:hypothetical protein
MRVTSRAPVAHYTGPKAIREAPYLSGTVGVHPDRMAGAYPLPGRLSGRYVQAQTALRDLSSGGFCVVAKG